MLHKKQPDFQERPACFSFLLLHLVSMHARLTKQLVRGWATTLCPLHTHCSFLFSKCDRDRPRVQPHVHPDATKEYISKLVRLEATSASDIYIYIYPHLSPLGPLPRVARAFSFGEGARANVGRDAPASWSYCTGDGQDQRRAIPAPRVPSHVDASVRACLRAFFCVNLCIALFSALGLST